MNLNKEQTNQLTNNQPYNCSLVKHPWSYSVFGTETSPLGNIITFESPLEAGALKLDSVLIIAGELSNTNSFGGTAFLRLYSAQIGSLLSEVLGKNCHVDESSIFVENQQCSITITNKSKDSFLFHILFSTGNSDQLFNLILDTDAQQAFRNEAVNSFHFLTKSIFLETQRDNF